MSHSEHTIVQKRRQAGYHHPETRRPASASDIRRYMDTVAAELANPSVKVADSSKQMWQKYSACRLRDFAHSQ
jgi:hypothetical protein